MTVGLLNVVYLSWHILKDNISNWNKPVLSEYVPEGSNHDSILFLPLQQERKDKQAARGGA